MTTDIARYLDHAILKPEMNEDDVRAEIKLGLQYGVRTVCIKPCDISLAIELCRGTTTDVCTVVGFPHGTAGSAAKLAEAESYLSLGVAEVDMVANYGWMRSGKWDAVQDEIVRIAQACHKKKVLLKVIFETAQLDEAQIKKAVEVCIAAKADFVKTSTGFYGDGANERVVAVMLAAAAGRVKVKASGGIRNRDAAERFIAMGVARLGVGSSSTPAICGPAGTGAEGKGY